MTSGDWLNENFGHGKLPKGLTFWEAVKQLWLRRIFWWPHD